MGRYSLLASAALLAAFTTAQTKSSHNDTALPPLNLGYFGYTHGNQFVAWTLPTPTTPLLETCDTRGAGINESATATWTSIRAYNTYVYKPICRNPFNITDPASGVEYYNLELACVDDNIALYANPEVTAVVDAGTNKTVETCEAVPSGNYVSCTGASEVLTWSFACS